MVPDVNTASMSGHRAVKVPGTEGRAVSDRSGRRTEASPARAAIFSPIGDEGRALLVERRLAEAIRSGVLANGERLPTEAGLAQLFGVALVTAREALVALRGQGLVTTVRGRNGGSFVTAPSGDALV